MSCSLRPVTVGKCEVLILSVVRLASLRKTPQEADQFSGSGGGGAGWRVLRGRREGGGSAVETSRLKVKVWLPIPRTVGNGPLGEVTPGKSPLSLCEHRLWDGGGGVQSLNVLPLRYWQVPLPR